MHNIVLCQLPEEVRATSLGSQQQEAEEVQERQRWVDTNIGASAADFLYAKRLVGGAESRCEDEIGFVGGSQIVHQEIREHSARCV